MMELMYISENDINLGSCPQSPLLINKKGSVLAQLIEAPATPDSGFEETEQRSIDSQVQQRSPLIKVSRKEVVGEKPEIFESFQSDLFTDISPLLNAFTRDVDLSDKFEDIQTNDYPPPHPESQSSTAGDLVDLDQCPGPWQLPDHFVDIQFNDNEISELKEKENAMKRPGLPLLEEGPLRKRSIAQTALQIPKKSEFEAILVKEEDELKDTFFTLTQEPIKDEEEEEDGLKGGKKSKAKTRFEVIKAKILNGTVEPNDLKTLSTRRTQDAIRIKREVFCQKLMKYAFMPYDLSLDEGEGQLDEEGKDVAQDLVKSLVKKLDKTNRLLAFAEIFKRDDRLNTGCFTILKGLDGRIQVSTRKFQPHLCYPRLFRYPGLRSGRELRPVAHCTRPFTEKFSEQVCINPWHVELLPSSTCPRQTPPLPSTPTGLETKKIETLYSQTPQPSLPSTTSNISTPVSAVGGCTPSPPAGGGGATLAPTRGLSTQGPTLLGPSLPLTHMGDITAHPDQQVFGDADLADALELISEDSIRMERGGGNDPMIGGTPAPLLAHVRGYSNSPHRIDVTSPYSDLPSLPPAGQPLSHLPQSSHSATAAGYFPPQQQPSMIPRYPTQTPFMSSIPPSAVPLQQPAQGMTNLSQIGRPQISQQSMSRQTVTPQFGNQVNPQVSRLTHSYPLQNVKIESPEPSSSPRPRESTYAVVSSQQQGPLNPHTAVNIPTNSASSPMNISTASPQYMVGSPQTYLTHWAQIMYYELDERVGETYKPTIDRITVDGFTSTTEPNRICLGAISNPRRNPAVLAVRRQIGRGIHLIRIDGIVKLECYSDSPVFVQSPVHAQHMGENLATVYRIAKGHSIEIFNEQVFEEMLNDARKSYKRTYQMQNMCQARVSFVKGFGAEYRRQTIQMTPCWIEIHFQDPLQRIDKILRSFQDHEGFASSFS